ncbi:hypothetical protein T484DRAFT_1823601 [Baffinella frigidus]|nr:hypothetical protein T484DRAFT_1823601 [Cryptophyta sp. CCMP2293]
MTETEVGSRQPTRRQYELYAGNSNPELTQRIAEQLKIKVSTMDCKPIKVSTMDCKQFNDGECNIKLHDSVRNAHVFVLQSTCPGPP